MASPAYRTTMDTSDEPTRTICARRGLERPLSGNCHHCADLVIEDPQDHRNEHGRHGGYFCRLWLGGGPSGARAPIDVTNIVPTAEAATLEAGRRLRAFALWRARRQ